MELVQTLLEIARHITGMAWKIAWGLVLGFAISGFIQAFASRGRVAEYLGKADLKSLFLATGVGAASSSCSYAAAAMSKSLFQKGAHIVNATAFLFASTNLVIEIGLVIWALLGWRFVVAEFFGGVLLILVVALLLKWLGPEGVFEEAKEHLEETEEPGRGHGGEGSLPWSQLFTRKGITAAGRYFAMDWRMIGKDIALGLVIAGTLAALVPREWWQTLFLAGESQGHPGFWVSLENAVVGPIIAVLSFVCSVGNIPLAAVLWAGGSSFGGVIAFIFADLVTIPMVLVYRRYYGWKPALVYAAFLFVSMVATALVVDWLFRWVGLAPDPGIRPGLGEKGYFAWDYTAILNLIFLPLGGLLFWLGSRSIKGGHEGHEH